MFKFVLRYESGEDTAADGYHLDVLDEAGWHIMAACGHRVSGGVEPGARIDACPNCQLAGKFRSIAVVYPGRLTLETLHEAHLEGEK